MSGFEVFERRRVRGGGSVLKKREHKRPVPKKRLNLSRGMSIEAARAWMNAPDGIVRMRPEDQK